MTEQAIREKPSEQNQGKICYWKDDDGLWWCYFPGCGGGVLSQHTIVEHDDGTITASPSILMHGHDRGTPTSRHGFLERGVWREI